MNVSMNVLNRSDVFNIQPPTSEIKSQDNVSPMDEESKEAVFTAKAPRNGKGPRFFTFSDSHETLSSRNILNVKLEWAKNFIGKS